jgi:hypothetical protein
MSLMFCDMSWTPLIVMEASYLGRVIAEKQKYCYPTGLLVASGHPAKREDGCP